MMFAALVCGILRLSTDARCRARIGRSPMPHNRHHGPSAHARPIDHQRVQRHARWEGDPRQRPQTAAEGELQTWRQRRLVRFLGVVIGGPALLLYLYAPQTVIALLRGSPPRPAVLRRLGGCAAAALM